jgi:hypothetical protein
MAKNKPKAPASKVQAPDLNLREIREREQREQREELDPKKILQLYAQNLDEIRRWFRNSSTPGHERGHVVLGEIFFTLSTEALTCALDGKSWSPGDRAP